MSVQMKKMIPEERSSREITSFIFLKIKDQSFTQKTVTERLPASLPSCNGQDIFYIILLF
jgi:hypothetical protein